MDAFAGFEVLTRQSHPKTDGEVLLVDAENLPAKQSTFIPGPRDWALTLQSSLASAMKIMSSWKTA